MYVYCSSVHAAVIYSVHTTTVYRTLNIFFKARLKYTLPYALSIYLLTSITKFIYKRGGQLGAQDHKWPFAHFSVALLILKISKNCYMYSDLHSIGLVTNCIIIIKFICVYACGLHFA